MIPRAIASGWATALATLALAHPPGEQASSPARTWTNARTGERVDGHFLAARAGKVAIETPTGEIASIRIDDLAGEDREIVEGQVATIRAANEARVVEAIAAASRLADDPAPAAGAARPEQAEIFDAFGPFVRTRFDDRWLYVESDGLPHPPMETPMMVGITAWQQQVPLPQPYVGTNAWQIPLEPELAERPISGRTALMRGAIALAANGIPIFNALNNGGRDSKAIGELDEFGGHCGRGDDYHYHAAPLFLGKVLGPSRPIAYALDGFPIYGLFDPQAKEGSPHACPLGSREPLDELNGHFCEVPKGEGIGGGTRTYHYHSSNSFPYVNGGLRGKVTIAGSGTDTQVVPQPSARGVRPALPPLRGARIVGFQQVAPAAWSLRYEVLGRPASVTYRLEEGGKVVFEFVDPDGTTRIEEHRPRERDGRGSGGGPRQDRGGDAGGGPRRNDPPASRPARGEEEGGGAGFVLSSAGVGPDGMLDARHTCDGAATSPEFSWRGTPKGTTSLALVISHRTRDGEERTYLVRFGLPGELVSLAEGDAATGRFGVNDLTRRAEYAAPCSQGGGEKVYVATLHALASAPRLGSGATPTKAELLEAIKDSTIATASLDLRYERHAVVGGVGDPTPPPTDEGGRPRRGRPRESPEARGRGTADTGSASAPGGEPARGAAPPADGRGGGGSAARGGGEDGEGAADAAPRRGLLDRMTGFHTDVPAHPIDVVLVRPTDRSIGVTVVVDEDADLLVEHWVDGSTERVRSARVRATAGRTALVELRDLAPSTVHRYRVGIARGDHREPEWGEESRFRTRASKGTPFSFVIQADSHLDANMSPEAYVRTLRNMRADAMAGRADFLVDLGDTFMTDKRGQDFERALPQYDAQRYYFGLACDAMPLFMVLGNHDGEKGDAPRAIAEWSHAQRTSRFPSPAIDGAMYTGRTSLEDGRGSHYYAFEWGDALFVVLDPFWSTTERSRGGGGRPGGGGGVELQPDDSSWSRTLGREQYEWLARTLAGSRARQKFVFTHHLVGGIGGSAARGGVESAPYFEWGGRNADGSEGFAARRPGWAMPIHPLLVKHGVTAVFHGHDHLYVHSTLDGIHYQCVPQPGNLDGGVRSAAEYGYESGTILGSPGHLRVSLAEDGTAKVEFVRTAIEGGAEGPRRRGGARSTEERGAGEANGAVVDRYEIEPRGDATRSPS